MIKNNSAFCILFLSLIHFSFAQITFQKTFEGANFVYGNSIQPTYDGGYIITGYTPGLVGVLYAKACLLKINKNGDTLWTKTFGDSSNDVGYSVRQTNDGGFIIGGTKNIQNQAFSDAYLVKTDSLGNLLWSKT